MVAIRFIQKYVVYEKHQILWVWKYKNNKLCWQNTSLSCWFKSRKDFFKLLWKDYLIKECLVCFCCCCCVIVMKRSSKRLHVASISAIVRIQC